MATFTNQATLTYRNLSTNSNIVTGELADDLTITKTAVGGSYTTGDSVTFAVNLRNAGTADITGLTLTDDLGAYPFGTGSVVPLEYEDGSVRYFANGVPGAAPTAAADENGLVISGVNVPAGGNALVLYSTLVNEYAPLAPGSSVVNSVTATGAGRAAPISDEESIVPYAESRLAVNKAIDPVTVTENGTLTYTFTVQNFGGEAADAADNVTLTDTFEPILSDITVTLNGTPLTAGTDYTYDETTGEFSTAAITDVPAAAFTQNNDTGAWNTEPGTAVLTVSGRV